MSPYVLPQYLLWLLLEMFPSPEARATPAESMDERSAPNDHEVTLGDGRRIPP